MTTLGQAVERLRERGTLPSDDNIIRVRNLLERFQPTPAGSVRSLIANMLEGASVKLPWAIILCRFKGLPGDPNIENLIRGIFTPGTGGLVEYWRDVSLGAIDISGSQVFGWVELDLKREDAGVGKGVGRVQLINAAIAAAQRDGLDPITGFHSQIAVFTHNFSQDGAPAGADWQDPVWGPYWIDGSSDGRRVSAPPHGQSGNFIAHEMGHGFNMAHDFYPDLINEYGDLCCIMSQQNSYTHPTWNIPFGPALCLPHLIQRGWMYMRRVYANDGTWLSQPNGITLQLAPITEPTTPANLGIKLAYQSSSSSWDYYLEYVKPIDWNQGLLKPYLIIRRMAEAPVYLGSIEVPTTLGAKPEWIEPSGNVRFQVERFDASGGIVTVNAKKL